MLPIKAIEDFAREGIKDTLITHDFSHFKRVSVGAKWFVRILNGTREEEDLAYIAGLLHDCVRPDTEKVDHAIASAEKARDILKVFNIDSDSVEKIVQAVRDHRKPAQWTSPLHQSIYLADKILEQMGHYIVFRRCMYIGECRDYLEKPFEWSIEKHFEYRLNKFDSTKFPTMFQSMVKEMLNPVINFYESFRKREEWAVRLARFCYEKSRSSSAIMDDIIKGFSGSGNEELYKKEAMKYISGNKFKEFERMIK